MLAFSPNRDRMYIASKKGSKFSRLNISILCNTKKLSVNPGRGEEENDQIKSKILCVDQLY